MAISASRIAARRISNTVFMIGCVGLTGVALFFLAAILLSLISQGIGGVNLAVFIQDTPTAGSTGGGLRNAIVGSVLMGVEAMIIAIFVGVFAGTWLSEYAGQSRYGAIIRFLNDVLLSAPSILIGLFVWEVFVHHVVGHFSGFAAVSPSRASGSPVITRTTEDVLAIAADIAARIGGRSGNARLDGDAVDPVARRRQRHAYWYFASVRAHQR